MAYVSRVDTIDKPDPAKAPLDDFEALVEVTAVALTAGMNPDDPEHSTHPDDRLIDVEAWVKRNFKEQRITARQMKAIRETFGLEHVDEDTKESIP